MPEITESQWPGFELGSVRLQNPWELFPLHQAVTWERGTEGALSEVWAGAIRLGDGGKKKPLKMTLGTTEILPAWAAHPTTTACPAGGALVEHGVLTPAHCTDGETEVQRRAGLDARSSACQPWLLHQPLRRAPV